MLSGVIIGIIFGFLLQRSQFCFVSGFRNIFILKDISFIVALFIAISVQSMGFFILAYYELIYIPLGELHLFSSILGGFIFGFGMYLSGFCAGGAWFRSAEGSLGAFLVLLIFSLTLASTHKGSLKWTMNSLQSYYTFDIGNIYTYFGISPFILVLVLFVITFFLLKISLKNHSKHTLKAKKKFYFMSFLIGLLGIVAWYFSSYEGREYGFGIAVPSANVIEYLVTGQKRYLNWGSFFVLGIFLGSFISAVINKEFRLTLPEPKDMIIKIWGAFMMGIGASLAGGCTITNSLVATAYFSIEAWISTIMIIFGTFIASVFFKATKCKI